MASAALHLYLNHVGWLCPLFAKHLFSSARWIFVILHFLKPQIFWEIIKMFLALILTLAAIKNRMCWGVQKQSDCFWMIFPQPFPLPGGRKPLTPLCDTVNPCAIRWGCGQGRQGRQGRQGVLVQLNTVMLCQNLLQPHHSTAAASPLSWGSSVLEDTRQCVLCPQLLVQYVNTLKIF